MTDAHAPRTRAGYALDAAPDAPDIRDRIYQPTLASVPDTSMPDRSTMTILDQGREGACTGFGLAAVVNLQRCRKYGPKTAPVSPRMLYEMARRFDEWTGDEYDGSSIRGALRGFFNNGVCLEEDWPCDAADAGVLTLDRARAARKVVLGAYYRVQPSIADMHAAIHEAGAVYASARVHDGWFDPMGGRIVPHPPSPRGGHAFAIVGYDAEGFWVQNSWGPDWGAGGIARWEYADWARGITDGWVLRIGVPTPGAFEVRARSGFIGVAPPGAEPRTTPRRAEIAGHFAHLDDGRFHDRGRYHTNAEDVRQTFEYLAKNLETYPRLLLYAHGGLNSPKASAGRIAAMKDTFKKNGIYPFHFMYDTGLTEELADVVRGKSRESEERTGGFFDFTDRIVEKLAGRLGTAIWSEMKEGTERAFSEPGDGTTILETIRDCLADNDVEIHLVGHSLGSVFMGHLLNRVSVLAAWPYAIKTMTLMAPACRTDFFAEKYLPRLASGTAERCQIESFAMYCLNDERERDDKVTPAYRKSLLYLVSNAFEPPGKASILGMQVFINQDQGRIIPERMPGKGVELDRDPAPSALDSLEGTGDDFPDDRLTRAAEIDELSVVVGEDMNAIGRQHATDERMARVDRRLREPRQVLDCLSNGRHLHPVPASKRGQDVKLGEVQERDERRRTRRRNVDER